MALGFAETPIAKMSNRSDLRQIALLTVVLWTVDVALFFVPSAIAGAAPGAAATARIVLIGLGGIVLSGAVYATVCALAHWRPVARYIAVITVAIICGGLVAGSDLMFQEPLRLALSPSASPLSEQMLLIHGLTNWIGLAWIFGLAGLIFLLLQSNRMVRQRDHDLAAAHAAALQAQNAATAARLAALRYQLNPHFLFNTLNAVSSAVVNLRIDEAETMLARLAEFLRITLAADPEAMVALEEELETLHAYLAIEGERFRERLGVRFKCPPHLLHAQVPSFLLQPLVENSIKHAVARTTRTVTLRLEARQENDDLVIVVEDDGEAGASPAPQGGGVGIRNVCQRLEALYGPRARVEAAALTTGYRVVITMPLQMQRDAAMAA